MSSSTQPASSATRPASPEERSSITRHPYPSASSASTTCEPMNPAPPVTIAACLAIARRIYPTACAPAVRSRRLRSFRTTRALQQRLDDLDRLVDPL